MIHSLSSLTDTNTKQVGRMIITKAIGYMSDEMENDYEHITENYKSKEGTHPHISKKICILLLYTLSLFLLKNY